MAEHLILSGAPEGYDAALLAREAARGAPVIHIARDDRRMAALEGGMRDLMARERSPRGMCANSGARRSSFTTRA